MLGYPDIGLTRHYWPLQANLGSTLEHTPQLWCYKLAFEVRHHGSSRTQGRGPSRCGFGVQRGDTHPLIGPFFTLFTLSPIRHRYLPTFVQFWIEFMKYLDLDTYTTKVVYCGRGGGQAVTVLAVNSDDPSLNPADVYSFFCKICAWKERK